MQTATVELTWYASAGGAKANYQHPPVVKTSLITSTTTEIPASSKHNASPTEVLRTSFRYKSDLKDELTRLYNTHAAIEFQRAPRLDRRHISEVLLPKA